MFYSVDNAFSCGPLTELLLSKPDHIYISIIKLLLVQKCVILFFSCSGAAAKEGGCR